MAMTKEQVTSKGAVNTYPRKSDLIARLDSISVLLNQGLAWVSAGCLLTTVLVIVGNAVMRITSAPFTGSTEVVGWLMAVTIAFGLGYTQVHRGYVDIEAVVERLPCGFQRCLKLVILLVSAVFFALVAWQVTLYGLDVMKSGNLSETLWVPYYPMIFTLSLGFTGLTIALLVDFLKGLSGGARK